MKQQIAAGHTPLRWISNKSVRSLRSWRLFVFAPLALAASLDGAEIMGQVRDTTGDTASVVTEGDLVPAVGDSGEIFFKVVDDAEVFVGSGRVLKVESDSIQLKIEDATGDVAKGQLVRITSENPQTRSPITAPSSSLSSSPEQSGKDAATPVPSAPVGDVPSARYAVEGLAKLDAKDFKGAIATYTKWIELDPTNSKPYANRGSAYNALKQSKRALADLNESLRLDPTISMAYVIRGNIYADLHQLKRAIKDYEEAIRIDPKNVSAYYARGTVYAELRQAKRAAEDFSEAIELKPTYKEAYWNRAACYEVIGKKELAKRDFTRFQELKAEASSSSPGKPAPVPPDL